jgi:hypothetical protein
MYDDGVMMIEHNIICDDDDIPHIVDYDIYESYDVETYSYGSVNVNIVKCNGENMKHIELVMSINSIENEYIDNKIIEMMNYIRDNIKFFKPKNNTVNMNP